MSTPHSNGPSRKLDSALLLLFTMAAGLSIGNLYWAQPLLVQIAGHFGLAEAKGGSLMTATQAGYALGILLIVPLGDFLQRKTMIPLLMGLTAAALLFSGLAPSFAVLAAALSLMGLATVTGQVVIPMVGDLAPAGMRGKMIGVVSSGITSGILLSRFVSGLVAGVFGWRAVYFMAAAFNLALLAVIARRIPRMTTGGAMPYHRVIASVFSTAVRVPALAWLSLLSGLSFCVFNMFWVSLTFLLSGEPYGYSTFQIGLVSLAGFSGAVVAQGVGRLVDKGVAVPSICGFTALMAAGMLCSFFSCSSLLLVLAAAAVVSVASQGVMILTQTTLFNIAPQARSRLNTVYVVSNFLWAAMGSAAASRLWQWGGLEAVTLTGMAVCALGILVWYLARTRLSAP